MSRPCRTGGVFLTMDGCSSNGRILELREVLNNEDNALRELSLSNVKRENNKLSLLVHDLACHCSFADEYGVRRMLDKFHSRNHTRPECRTTLNPQTPSNARYLRRMGVLNTSMCEQMFRVMNRHRHALTMARSNNKAFCRHWCIFYNSSSSTTRRRMLPPFAKKARCYQMS